SAPSTSASPTRSGRSSARPSRSASAETGEGSSRRPRPRGRSGWLTTATTRWGPARSRASVGTAKSGVPKKTSRSAGAAAPLDRGGRAGLFALLAQLLLAPARVHAALEPADAVDEEDAVEVVDLVLEAHGLEVFGLDLDRVPVEVGRAQAHALRALDLGL